MTEMPYRSKRLILFAILLGLNFIFTTDCFSQNKLTTGTWITEDTTLKIQFHQRETAIYGKIIWIKDGDNLKDVNNKEKATRKNRNLVGLDMFKSFEPDGDNQWKGGNIYDPVNGRTYNSTLKLIDTNRLEAKGFITFALKLRKLVLIKAD